MTYGGKHSGHALSAPVAEGLAGEHHECLGGRPEVHIPTGLIKSVGEGLGEFLRLGFVWFVVEGGPEARLVGCGALGTGATQLTSVATAEKPA